MQSRAFRSFLFQASEYWARQHVLYCDMGADTTQVQSKLMGAT